MILIGEPTVGVETGLYTPQRFLAFFLLYLSLFHLFEALIVRYRLVVFQVVLLTFALYSVLVTGFLNKELTEYVLNPDKNNPLFVTLIRIQASFFAAFAFYLLNKIVKRREEEILSLKQSLWFFLFVILLVSTSGAWGFPKILFTLQIAPLLSLIFISLGMIALYVAFKAHPDPTSYSGRKITILAVFYLLLGIVPSISVFLVLLITMILGGIYILLNRDIRNLPL